MTGNKVSVKGITGLNAETKIDYENKKIEFEYPVLKGKNEKEKKWRINYAYYNDNRGMVFYLIIKAILYFAICLTPMYFVPELSNARYVDQEKVMIYIIWLLIFTMFAWMWLWGMIQLTLNTFWKRYRENYPKAQANSIFRRMMYKKREYQDKEYDLTKDENETLIKECIIVKGNQIFILDYDVVSFNYKYIGENKLIKVETKSIENEDHKREHGNFICMMTFKKPVTEGTLKYGWK